MPEQTGLEMLEEKATPLFGNASGLGTVDKSMLEMSDTNRWVYDARQSELSIAWKMIHDALVACDARNAKAVHVQDRRGQWTTKYLITDHWRWMLDMDYQIKTNQLTIKAFSRMQHLRQSASMSAITQPEEEPRSFWAKLFGVG